MTKDLPHNDVPRDESKTERFLRLIIPSEKRIYAFILVMVPDLSEADDLMQETVMVMWRKFEEFEPGKDFVAWGMGIARYEVLEYRQKKRKSQGQFNHEVLTLLQADSRNMLDHLDNRLTALQECLAKLSESDRRIIGMRYEQGLTTKDISQRVEKSVHSIYRSMVRVHDVLLRCIRRTLAMKGLT